MYPNPILQQQMALLDQEYAQKKNSLMQSFYEQAQQNNWGQQSSQSEPSKNKSAQNVNWIQVSGIDGAKNQIVQPGQTAWMMDNNEPYFYVKSVDEVGSSTFRIFQFAEVADVAPEQTAQPQIDPSKYVQRDEFERFKEQLEQLTTSNKKQPAKANKGVEDNG